MLLCGVDIGSTNVKVGLSDGGGLLRHVEIVPTPRQRDEFGPVAHPGTLLQLIEDLILRAWRMDGGPPITAICTTGVGEDGLLLDADLRPLGPVIPWFDRRAAADADALRASAAATTRAGIAMDPTRTGAKWRWLRRHCPDLVARARLWVALTDYPLIAWGAAPFMAETLAARTGCYDPVAHDWIGALLAECGAPPLPPVIPAPRIVGRMSSPRLIAAGAATPQTLLAAGGHDHPIAASTILRHAPSARIDSLGTASVLYAEIPSAETASPALLAHSVPVRGGAGLAVLGVVALAEALQGAAAPAEIRAFLQALPLPGQPGQPLPLIPGAPDGRPIRAVLEAAAMTTRAMLEALPPGPVHATGGWSRSKGLLQLRASVLDRTIFAAEEPELALVGAVLMAAEAAGAPADLRPRSRAIPPLPAWRDAYAAAWPGFLHRLQAAQHQAGGGGL
ncbi:FGGY family carbohydrate kinase [Paracoccus sp. S1E-3]|uniref:FGGY family carbohydrate kinase n=1 Tax=Paracoccus sp. S1E-3 TaxID=2756130 RepID=UPI0015EF015D|nr:FGGY family carbohydrate kinase [Paracoccus sp. S1E-3]MBA4491828.1 hypothetical protein [Paracoccus sp. S1E-3]